MRQIESPPLTDRQTGLTAEVPGGDATVNFGSAPMLEAVESHRATGNPMGIVPTLPLYFPRSHILSDNCGYRYGQCHSISGNDTDKRPSGARRSDDQTPPPSVSPDFPSPVEPLLKWKVFYPSSRVGSPESLSPSKAKISGNSLISLLKKQRSSCYP